MCKSEKWKREGQSQEGTKHRHNKIEIQGEVTGILVCKGPWFGKPGFSVKEKGKGSRYKTIIKIYIGFRYTTTATFTSRKSTWMLPILSHRCFSPLVLTIGRSQAHLQLKSLRAVIEGNPNVKSMIKLSSINDSDKILVSLSLSLSLSPSPVVESHQFLGFKYDR